MTDFDETQQQPGSDDRTRQFQEKWDSLRIEELESMVGELNDCIGRLRRELRVGIQRDTGVRLCIVHNSGTRKMISRILSAQE